MASTLRCPYCNVAMKKWQVPHEVYTGWPNDFFYVCFNDQCAYYIRGYAAMASQGNPGSYRLLYDPLKNCCRPVPVFNADMLRDWIIA